MAELGVELEKEQQVVGELQMALGVLASLNQAIRTGPWKASLFLRSVGKKLCELRDELQQELGLTLDKTMAAETIDDSGEQEVYIALYQSQGEDLHKWWPVIVSLVNHSTSRPVYKKEADAKAAAQIGKQKLNHGYVVVRVRSEDIASWPDGGQPLDREGRERLVLCEAAIHLKKIVRFVHASGEYKLQGHLLVKQG